MLYFWTCYACIVRGVWEFIPNCEVLQKLCSRAANASCPCFAGPGFPSPRALSQRLDRAPGQALQPAPRHLLRAPRGVGAGAAAAGGAPGGAGQQPALLGTAQPRLPPGERPGPAPAAAAAPLPARNPGARFCPLLVRSGSRGKLWFGSSFI